MKPVLGTLVISSDGSFAYTPPVRWPGMVDFTYIISDGHHLNVGSGQFGPAPFDIFGGGQSSGVALGDLDGDGDLDVIISNYYSEAQEVWLNQGVAQGGTPGHFGMVAFDTFGGGNSTDVELNDLDDDGDLDAVIVNDNDEAQEVWLNQGGAQGGIPGDFGTTAFDAFSWRPALDVALGDLD